MKPPLDRPDVEFAWNLFTELRKELVESQKLRTQVIGFKVTFVSTAVGLIAASYGKNSALLVVPAFAAIFFDLLILSYSFSVKRIGAYCRSYLEPVLQRQMPGTLLWQEYLTKKGTEQPFARYGNLGLTLLAVATGAYSLLPVQSLGPGLLLAALLAFLGFDVLSLTITTRRRFPTPQGRAPRD